MNIENTNIDMYQKPENVSDEDWYALDLSDPLMAVC